MSSFNQSNMDTSLNASRRNSLLFSNRTLNDSMASRQSKEDSFISTNRFKSPFYEGKVSFGGASAKRVRLSQVMPYNLASKPSTITRIKDSDIKRLNEFEPLSNATKNVLQNIYKASSPLEDAKKIPVFDSSTHSINEKYMIDSSIRPFKRLSNLRTPKLAASVNTSSPIDREKLQLKWEQLENTSSKTLINNSLLQISDNLMLKDTSGNYYQQTNQNNKQSKVGGKIKDRLTRTTRTTKWPEDEDYLNQAPIDLPNIALPIDNSNLSNLKFNLSNANVNSNKASSNKRQFVSITYDDDDSSDAFEEFKFSAPKAIKLEKISDSFIKDSIAKNQKPKSSFSTSNLNLKSDDKQNIDQEKNSSEASFFNLKPNTTSASSIITVTTTSSNLMNLETNKTVGMYKVDKLDVGDFNPKENKATLANTNLPIKTTSDTKLTNTFNYDGLNIDKTAFLPSNKKWDCDMCWVKNELSATKCIACEQPRLKECKDKNVNNIYSNYSFGSINTEKKGFSTFKLGDFKSSSPISVSTNNSNNSFLSNVLSTVNTTSAPITITSLPNKIESTASGEYTKSSLVNQLTLTNKLTTTNQNEQNKPFNFVSNELADKIDISNKNLSSSSFFGSKAEEKPLISTSNASTDTKLKNTFNFDGLNVDKTAILPSNKKWDCDQCLVKNELSATKCVCCEHPRLQSQVKECKDKDVNNIYSNNLFATISTDNNKFKLNDFKSSSPISVSTNNNNSFLSNVLSTVNTTTTSAPITISSLTNKTESKTSEDNIKSTNKLTTTIQKEPNKSFNFISNQVPDKIDNSNKISNTAPLFGSIAKPLTSTLNAPAATFSFNQAAKDATEIKTEKQTTAISKPSNFVFGGPVSNPSLNNGGFPFNLTNTQQPSTTNFFTSQNTTNNSTAPISSLSTFGSNQFGTKTQFGMPAGTGIFSQPANLTNGFNSSTTETTNNLFAGTPSTNQQPAISNFTPSFTSVPTSFNFANVASNQIGNPQSQNAIFKFQTPPDQSIGQPPVRQIKKAKRRLGSKD